MSNNPKQLDKREGDQAGRFLKKPAFWTILTGFLIIVFIVIGSYFRCQQQPIIPKDPVTEGERREEVKKIQMQWDEAVRILQSGQVQGAFQAHNLQVYLYLKDGSIVETKEPHIDDIYDEIAKCGDPCKDIIVATE